MINLIGKSVEVHDKDYVWYKSGKIIDIIPAGIKPTKEIMTKFYGNNWENKKCKDAFRAIKHDRVLFIDETSKHHIVLPLNPKLQGSYWRLFNEG